MSMNLIFIKGRCHEEFPYQTSTKLTYAVLEATTREEKIKLIEEDIKRYGYSLEWLKEIREMLDNGWQISMI